MRALRRDCWWDAGAVYLEPLGDNLSKQAGGDEDEGGGGACARPDGADLAASHAS